MLEYRLYKDKKYYSDENYVKLIEKIENDFIKLKKEYPELPAGYLSKEFKALNKEFYKFHITEVNRKVEMYEMTKEEAKEEKEKLRKKYRIIDKRKVAAAATGAAAGGGLAANIPQLADIIQKLFQQCVGS